MLNHSVKIGIAPMRRNTTDRPPKTFLTWTSAVARKEKNVAYIKEHFASENVSFVDTSGLGCNDLIFDDASAKAAAERFNEEKIDALLIINCNFGNEEAAADLAKAVGKPTLLYAPLDDEYYADGMRPTDSQCGLFGVSRQFQRYHIPFSHVPCCRVEEDAFAEAFDRFVRVACMVKNFTGLRIGQVGTRPAPFFSVIWNEGELMERFGVRVVPINLAVLQDRFNKCMTEKRDEIEKYIGFFKAHYKMDDLTPQYLERMACLVVTYIGLFAEFDLDVISAECWTATPIMFGGLAPCAVYAVLSDLGYTVSCESDMHCAMTMVLLESASLGKKRPIMGEFTVRHPENKNAELLWHCGPFPLSVKDENCTPRLVNQRVWMKARDGKYTLARIDQDNGYYTILADAIHTTAGPETHGTYLWGEFDDLQAWEDKLLDGPYIHHFAEIEGDYTKELREFLKYCPALHEDHV